MMGQFGKAEFCVHQIHVSNQTKRKVFEAELSELDEGTAATVQKREGNGHLLGCVLHGPRLTRQQ